MNHDVNSKESHIQILHTCAEIQKIQIFSDQSALNNAPELSERFRKLVHMTTGNLF